MPAAKDRTATIDHVIALSVGGSDTFENTVAACVYCNTTKGSLSVEEFRRHPKLIARLEIALSAPDRLSNDPASQFHDQSAINRGVVVRLNGKPKSGICEYSAIENWVRVKAGKARDKHGKPVTLKINGTVEAYYTDTAQLLAKTKRRDVSP